ncbi:MAG: tetratricopeptide repeat protein, partial [Muribaculaceae bacterium]|nr:tetratricopeptide repeat protein [Muribaculaceae bacterium]
KAVYDYAISVARQECDKDRMAQYASQALPIFGKEDDRYIGCMINDKLQNKQYDEAMTMLEQYIQADPNNAQLYYVRGVIYDTKEEPEKAMADYKKSLDLAPDNSSALFNYGRTIYNKAIILSDSDALANLPTAEYNKALEEQVYPIFREAAGYLEKAYQLDEDNMASKTLPLLRNIYYNLKDDSNLKRIEELEKY